MFLPGRDNFVINLDEDLMCGAISGVEGLFGTISLRTGLFLGGSFGRVYCAVDKGSLKLSHKK